MNQALWIIDQLVAQGVTQFCIAPGSRSAPLALAAKEHPKANIVVHFDERGLGFYALGIAKASKSPSAVITTSGTAVANLYPAAIEAHHSKIPLILLTADRPHELRSCGANQSIDQVDLFGKLLRTHADLHSHLDEKTTRSIVAHHVFLSLQNPPGPVHLNCPFQEPFHLFPSLLSPGRPISFVLPTLSTRPIETEAKRGVILLGPIDDPTPVLQLAKRLQWPVFADLLSQARSFPSEEQIRHFDFLLKQPLEPDLIIHFGDRFISKDILKWADKTPAIHVSPFPSLQDPERRLFTRVQSDIKPFCDSFQGNTDPNWLPAWQRLDQEIDATITASFQKDFSEAHAIFSLPANRPIFFGNSMPIRHADRFFFPNRAPLLFANRGASGIDGNIATMSGIAEALKTPLLGFIGDQAALHDLNSLPLIKKHQILLIISNNFGGAIFDYLPVAKSPHLNELFTASHPWSFEKAADMFEIPYVKMEGKLNSLPSFGIVELITDRKENFRFHEKICS